MTNKQFQTFMISNSNFMRFCSPNSLQDKIDYLKFMSDFYFSAIIQMNKFKTVDKFYAEMSSTIQMMYTKSKLFMLVLNGFSDSDGINNLRNITDHTVLFTIVRTAYEQLCAFELVCTIPDTDDKKTILQNAYIAAGLTQRKNLFKTDKEKLRNREALTEETLIIEKCKTIIHETNLYQQLSKNDKNSLDRQVFDLGHYQLYFDENNKLDHKIGWDKIRSHCSLGTDILNGMYDYACSMTHPSYFGLIQFREAYHLNNDNNLIDTAVMELTAIMSVFIMDYMTKYPIVKQYFDAQSEETKYLISRYNNMLKSRDQAE